MWIQVACRKKCGKREKLANERAGSVEKMKNKSKRYQLKCKWNHRGFYYRWQTIRSTNSTVYTISLAFTRWAYASLLLWRTRDTAKQPTEWHWYYTKLVLPTDEKKKRNRINKITRTQSVRERKINNKKEAGGNRWNKMAILYTHAHLTR